MEKSFSTTGNKGFHITLPNGITISTQFGGGNYCENYHNSIMTTADQSSNDAELAVWDKDGKWITQEILVTAGYGNPEDQVVGNIDIIKWLKILDTCRAIQ